MLDTVRAVHTPEGVDLRLPAAGPVPRAVAWAIDLGIRGSLLMAGTVLFGALGNVGAGFYLLALFLVFWGYPIACEAMLGGQTPGKRAMDLKVVAIDGAPAGWLAVLVRNLLRVVDMLPFGYATGLVASLADPWGRRLGDLVAGTLVVHAPRERPVAAPAGEALHVPAVVLQPPEQAAIIAFAERAPQLTEERQAELADIAAPIAGAGGVPGVRRLAGIANWLLGRR
jgi:uncharacterized RDD family membrane protein YckC